MKAIIFLLWTVSCLDVDPNHDSDLLNTSRGDVYVKAVLSDFGVRKNVFGGDKKYNTALHYLSYEPKSVEKPLALQNSNFLNTGSDTLKFKNILLSYQKTESSNGKGKDNTTLFTCRLEGIPFASETTIEESAKCFEGIDDAYRFANMCVEHGKIVFHKDSSKDFSCDLSTSDCEADACRIQVNAGCVVDSTSSSGQCAEVKASWDDNKDKASIAFVEQIRKSYSSCSYKDSALNCVSKAGG